MNRKMFIAFLIGLMVIASPFGTRFGFAASNFQVVQTYWGSAANPLEVGPGDRAVTLNVVVQNIGTQTYSGLSAILNLVFPFVSITGANSANGYSSGNILPAQTVTLQFQVNVDASASIGLYPLVVSLFYGAQFNSAETETLNVALLGTVQWNLSLSPTSISPGSRNMLTLDVSNKGTGAASKASVTLNFPSGVSITGSNQWVFPSVGSNEDKTITLDAYAQPGLAGSSLQIGAYITYIDAYGTNRNANMAMGLQVSPISNVSLILTVEGSDLLPGTLNTISLSILNNQTRPVSSIQASLVLPSGSSAGGPPLVISGDNTWSFPSIEPLRSVSLNAQVVVSLSAAGTNYQPTLTLSYIDASNISRSENHAFGVRVLPAQNVLLTSVQGYIITAGLFNQPRIMISNLGKGPVRSITASLAFGTAAAATSVAASLVLSGGNQWYFDDLQPHSNVTFSPTIFATLGAVDTSYQAQLSISYTDQQGVARVETDSIGFVVKGLINIHTQDVQISPSSVEPGGNITIVGNLLNRGNAPGMYVSVYTTNKSPYFSDQTQYIGEVDTNTLTPFSITEQVDRRAPNGTYPIIITVEYSDNYNVTQNITYSTSFVVASQSRTPVIQTQSETLILGMTPMGLVFYVAIAAIIIVTTTVLWRNRRTMRQKSNLETAAGHDVRSLGSIGRRGGMNA